MAEHRGNSKFRTIRQILAYAVLPILTLVVATIVIREFDLDRIVSGLCYQEGRWVGENNTVFTFLYQYGEFPGLILGVAGCCWGIAGLTSSNKSTWKIYGFFLAVALIIGPGIIVNGLFKPYWSRPRPLQVTEFGGDEKFVNALQASEANSCRSFPSGHASIAFYLIAPGFICLRRNRNWSAFWFLLGVSYGGFIGMIRIAQGSHFLSDIVWAAGIVYLSCTLAAYLFGLMGARRAGVQYDNVEEPVVFKLEDYRQPLNVPHASRSRSAA